MNPRWLYLLLVCLGAQWVILSDMDKFSISVFGEVTDATVAISWALVVALCAIEALTLVVWLQRIDKELEEDARAIRHRENESVIGTGSRVGRTRADSLNDAVGAEGRRWRSAFALYRGKLAPVFTAALLLSITAGAVAACSIGRW